MPPTHRPLTSLALVLFLLPAPAEAAPADRPKEATLSKEDRKFLDRLVKNFLFDPKGAARVRVPTIRRSVWASSEEVVRDGWLVSARGGRPARVFFTDGDSIPAPKGKALTKVDFLEACRRRLVKEGAAGEDEDGDRAFRGMRRTAVGWVDESPLVLAAWLHRRGQDELAALALARVKDRKADETRLRQELAWSAFAGMVHAYMVRADAEALSHGERLLRLYPAEAKAYKQSKAVVADLKRRQKKGTFGKAPAAKWPEGFARWDVKKKVAFLVEALEEVDARQGGQPGGVSLGSDRRVAELIRVGEPAVPALIDVIEKDERLTRSVHFWRDFARSRTVLAVREAALTAVMSILRVQVFEPASTGDNFTARGKTGAEQTAARLRAYWKRYGKFPFDERMMKVLTDPKAKPEALREAADNLASLGDERTLSTTVFSGGGGARRKGPNPAVAKFSKPTVAEAILAAMDRDLAAYDARTRDSLFDYSRRGVEDAYLFPLIQLQDTRVAPALARRAKKADTGRMRRKWAYAGYWLKDPLPFNAFARDVEAGRVPLPANDKPNTNDQDQPGTVELRGIVGYLANIGTPECDRALNALAGAKHPYHALVVKQILAARSGWREGPWLLHPYCLTVLRQALDDTTPTGATYTIEGKRLKREEGTGWSAGGIPDLLADPAVRKDKAPERACDVAAEKVEGLVVGLAPYHPLLRDADMRLAALRAALDRFRGRYRRLRRPEGEALNARPWDGYNFIADVKPLGRPATAADVKSGKALFHLGGKGKVASLKLPAVGVLTRDAKAKRPVRVLIVQAEEGPGEEITYGIIGKNEARAVVGKEMSKVEVIDKKEPQPGEKR